MVYCHAQCNNAAIHNDDPVRLHKTDRYDKNNRPAVYHSTWIDPDLRDPLLASDTWGWASYKIRKCIPNNSTAKSPRNCWLWIQISTNTGLCLIKIWGFMKPLSSFTYQVTQYEARQSKWAVEFCSTLPQQHAFSNYMYCHQNEDKWEHGQDSAESTDPHCGWNN